MAEGLSLRPEGGAAAKLSGGFDTFLAAIGTNARLYCCLCPCLQLHPFVSELFRREMHSLRLVVMRF